MARSMIAFFSDRQTASTSSWVIGPLTTRSSSSFGISTSAVAGFLLLGILTPLRHGMPRTQKIGHVLAVSIFPARRGEVPPFYTPFALQQDNWNDYGFQTLYHLYRRQPEPGTSPALIGSV